MAKKHKLRHVISQVYDTPWAITRGKLNEIEGFLDRRAEGQLPQSEIDAFIVNADRSGDKETVVRDGVAVIPLMGTLGPRMNMMMSFSGGTSTQEFADAVHQAANDDDITSIVLDIDSPGGSVLGTEEAAAVVREAREIKPVIAVATGQMASAAYWIGSAATSVIASPSSQVGSIGVLMVHNDVSARNTLNGVVTTVIHAATNKTEGNSQETLDQNAQDSLRSDVNDYFDAFVDAVALNRGVSAETVKTSFGEGSSFIAAKALSAGMIDGIGTLSETVAGLAEKSDSADTIPSFIGAANMHQDIMKALIKKGLISGSDDAKAAQAALNGWYAHSDKDQPETVEAVLADLNPAMESTSPTPFRDSAIKSAVEEARLVSAIEPAPLRLAEAKVDTAAIATAERDRIQNIQARGETLGVKSEVIATAVSEGTSVEKFLLDVTADQSEKETPVAQLTHGESARDKFFSACEESLLCRSGMNEGPISANASDMQHMSMAEMAEKSLVLAGIRPEGDKEDIISMALEQGHRITSSSTSSYQQPGDFGNVLSNLANKALDPAPDFQASTFRTWCSQRASLPDFKPATLVRTGEFGELPLVRDGDDFPESETSEEFSWIQTDKYGDIFSLTPVMIANDDLGAFMEALQDKSQAHDQTLNRLCVNILTGNPDYTDGTALFHADHSNLIASGSGTAPTTAAISALRLLARSQTGVSDKRKMNQTINLILVPEALETTAQELLSKDLPIFPVTEANVATFKGIVQYVVEPMLTDSSASKWYAFSNPAVARSIRYVFQRGFEGMKRTSWFDPNSGCQKFKFEGRFAAAIGNYRGVFHNFGS